MCAEVIDTSSFSNPLPQIVGTLGSVGRLEVRVDDRRGADALFPDSWEWEDLPYDYGAPPSSSIVDGNVVKSARCLFFVPKLLRTLPYISSAALCFICVRG